MSEQQPPAPGTVFWQDLTVPNAEAVRDFYRGVIGWETRGEPMGDYEDFHMLVPSTGKSTAGVCHARGENADLPPQWLIYIAVEDVDRCTAKCVGLGGEIVAGPRHMDGGRFAVIRDPAGAVCALYSMPG